MEYLDLVLPEHLSQCLTSKNCAHVFHLNARSATNKHDSIISLLDQCRVSFDLIMFTETWYQQDADMLIIQGYKHFFLNRKERRGGGVAIHVKRSIKSELMKTFSEVTCNYEVLSLKFRNSIVIFLYRPPSAYFDIILLLLKGS